MKFGSKYAIFTEENTLKMHEFETESFSYVYILKYTQWNILDCIAKTQLIYQSFHILAVWMIRDKVAHTIKPMLNSK